MLLKNHWILSILLVCGANNFIIPTCYIILIFLTIAPFSFYQLNQSCFPDSIMYFLPCPWLHAIFLVLYYS